MNKVIYFSRGGNTKKVADAIAAGIGVTAESVSAGTPEVKGADTLFVGGSLYAGGIASKLKTFLSGLNEGDVKKVVVFSTSTSGETAMSQVKKLLDPKNIPVSDAEFYCKGSFLLANKGRPNAEDLKAAEDFAKSNI